MNFFGVGVVSENGEIFARYRVRSKGELRTIINHFNNNPLEGRKALQYSIWIEIANTLVAEQKRTEERDTKKINNLIKELSNL